MRLRRKRAATVETTPTTPYVEIRAHRGGQITGYLPEAVFDAITGRTDHEGTFWINREQAERLRAHPQFVPVGQKP